MPKIINLPFTFSNRKLCLSGRKVATSRPTKYGESGDFFMIGQTYFEIIRVSKLPLSAIADNFFYQEGYDSREDFIREWKSIHPNKGFLPYWQVYYHEFIKRY